MEWLRDAIRNLWEMLAGFLVSWIGRLFEFIEWAVKTVTDFIWGVVEFCLDMAWDFCVYIYDLFLGDEGFIWYIFDFVIWFADAGIDSLMTHFGSDGIAGVFDWFQPGVLQTVIVLAMGLDKFFPVSEGITLLCSYLGFIVVVLLIRWCLKIVPGLGG